MIYQVIVVSLIYYNKAPTGSITSLTISLFPALEITTFCCLL